MPRPDVPGIQSHISRALRVALLKKKTPVSAVQRLQTSLGPWFTSQRQGSYQKGTIQDSTPATTWFRNLRKAEMAHRSAAAASSSDHDALPSTLTLIPEYVESLKRPARHDESPYEKAARLSRQLDNLKHMLAKEGQELPPWDTLDEDYSYERLSINNGLSVALYLLVTFLSVLAILEIVECYLVARSRRTQQGKKGSKLGRGDIFLESDQDVAFSVCKPRPSSQAWTGEDVLSEKSRGDSDSLV